MLDYFIDHDPADAAAMAGLQGQVRLYLDLCEFVHTTLEEGESADRHIQETFGNDAEQYSD